MIKDKILDWKIEKSSLLIKLGITFFLTLMYNSLLYIANPFSPYWIAMANHAELCITVPFVQSFINSWIILESSILISNVLEKRFSWTRLPVLRFVLQTILMIFVMFVLFSAQCIAFIVLDLQELSNESLFESLQFILMSFLFAVLVSVLHTIYFLINKWKQSIMETASLQVKTMELKEIALQFELQSLKAQLDPHFLFNNFSTLSELINLDPHTANVFLKNLTHVYRYMIQNQRKDLISVKEEMDFVNAYSYLVYIRHSDNIKFNVNLDDDVMRKHIPPISIQLLIENAIKHNIATKDNPLIINITSEDDKLIVSNNLQAIKNLLHSTGIGLQNIKDRYKILLSEESPSVVKSENKFCVSLPLL